MNRSGKGLAGETADIVCAAVSPDLPRIARERLNYPLFFKREALKAEIQIDDCIPVGSLSPPATAFR
jgi:hypothetical protein